MFNKNYIDMKKIQTIILASAWCFVVWATGLMHWELIQDIEGIIAGLVYGLILAFNGFLIYIGFSLIFFLLKESFGRL